MANDLNQCQFIGRLGKDVETRYLPEGSAVSSFSLACNWKGKESEGVEWIRIVAFGKLAEICAKYLHSGSQVYISGRMRTRKWQDKEGNDRYTTEIIADRMQMLGGRKEGDSAADYAKAKGGSAGSAPPPKQRTPGGFDEMDDDIPF